MRGVGKRTSKTLSKVNSFARASPVREGKGEKKVKAGIKKSNKKGNGA